MVIYRIFGLKKSSALKICSKQKSALSLASPALGRELALKDRREVRRSWKKKRGLFEVFKLGRSQYMSIMKSLDFGHKRSP